MRFDSFEVGSAGERRRIYDFQIFGNPANVRLEQGMFAALRHGRPPSDHVARSVPMEAHSFADHFLENAYRRRGAFESIGGRLRKAPF